MIESCSLKDTTQVHAAVAGSKERKRHDFPRCHIEQLQPMVTSSLSLSGSATSRFSQWTHPLESLTSEYMRQVPLRIREAG